ncbi:MAG: Rieske (2Fe-2S) protein, partial [Robiginitomaculum sp.]|nr:Rieske (2Fe-2S) protein [Robiginitomaculum sp.]
MSKLQTFVEDIWYFADFSYTLKRGSMQHKTIAGHPIVIGRGQDGAVFALRDICPHRAAPLSAGRIVGDSVECPYHGWRFGLSDGQCKEIPSICAGQKNPKDGIKLRNYPVQEQGSLVWIYIAKDKKFTGNPPLDPPQFAQSHLKPRMVERLTLDAHVDHAVIGLMDPAHVSYLHKQWWWRT